MTAGASLPLIGRDESCPSCSKQSTLSYERQDDLPAQSIYLIILSIAAAESLTLAVIVWRRNRRDRGLAPFLLLMAAVSLWTLGYAAELGASDLATKLFWIRMQYIGIVAAPVGSLLFAAAYTGRSRWMTLRSLVAIAIVPVATVLLVWTNDWHGLFYREVGVVIQNGVTHFDPTYGPWFYVHLGYSYLMLLLAMLFIFTDIIRSPQLYQGQVLTMGLAALAPWIANAVYVFGLSPFGRLDLTPFGFTVTGFSLGWSLISYRLLDIVPAARSAAIEGMTDAVIVIDARNRIVDLNPAAEVVLNRTLVDVIGMPLIDIVPKQRALLERFQDAGNAHAEIKLENDAAGRTFDLRVTMLKTRKGMMTGRLIVLRDISDQKKAERELEKANNKNLDALRVKSRILAIVGHDIRTPLSAIMGYTDMLLAGVQGELNDSQKEILRHLMGSADALHTMMNDLLDQAQIEGGTITINSTRFDPQSLLKGIMVIMTPRAAQKGIDLKTEITPELVGKQVYGDLARIAQCLNNIVENALKFTNKGSVTIRIYQPGESRWAISVQDTGPGMDEQALARAFEPFWQGDSTITREHQGVGLGLSISKQLVAMMEGTIEVDSVPGMGTTFRIILPMQSSLKLLKGHSYEKV